MKAFCIDTEKEILKTYENLLEDISNQTFTHKYVFNRNIYKIFLSFINSILHGVDIVLLDYDMSEKELESIGLNSKLINETQKVDRLVVNNIDELLVKLKEKEETSSIVLYTSGTTGKPKRIQHTMKSLLKKIKVNSKYEMNVWGLAYNPTHFAGIQVFLQALFNKNSIVNLFDTNIKNISHILLENKVTNISATPTFYRKMFQSIKEPNLILKCLTSGGEKFDSETMKKIKEIFPEAKCVNIYALTEAGVLFNSHDGYFKINDMDRQSVKISDVGELLLHENILGKSEKLVFENGWFHTGDIVFFEGDGRFRIVARNTDLINVGGYNVNPHEVEACMLELAEIKDVLIYGRKNKITGNIIAADIIVKDGVDKNLVEEMIFKHLKTKLQPWKIPRIIKFVDAISITRSGKKVRK